MKVHLLIGLLVIPPGAAVAVNAKDKPKQATGTMVCRDIDETGSRLRSNRVCMTKEQGEETRRQTQADVMQGQNRLIQPCPPKTNC